MGTAGIMTDFHATHYSDGDVDTNTSDNPTLESLVDARYSRRQALMSGAGVTSAAFLGGALLTACGDDKNSAPSGTVSATGGATSSGAVFGLSAMVTNASDFTTFAWSQVSGPAVTIVNPTSLTANFLAPSVASATPVAFKFTGTTSGGKTVTSDATVTVNPATIGFTAISKSLADVVTVPAGYNVTVLYRLGDPINSATPAYANNGSDTNMGARVGDHGDAMYWFGLGASGATRDDNSSTRGLIVQNHENITQPYLHANGPTSVAGVRPEAEAIKEIESHGVLVVEVSRGTTGTWSYNQASTLNRRITPLTPMTFTGPVAGSTLLRTVFSPTGTAGRGTINNCANGFTFWGTSITCEENWVGYFRRRTTTDNPLRTAKEIAGFARYGATSSTGNYGWATVVPADTTNTFYRRWTTEVSVVGGTAVDDFRNEINQFGWIVEVDPYDPAATPRKRTALGRMNHEGCWPGNFVSGVRPAFYMGDDARGEYIYKFVSATPWAPADATAANRLAIGDKYLDTGTLYAARFNADGSGIWLPLVFGTGPLTATGYAPYGFADQADVLTHARIAADALGATKMDRPEWTGVNPKNGEMYTTLTNNNATLRPLSGTDAANPRHYNDPRGTTNNFGNPNGHIIRLRETGNTTEATGFTWDNYVFGAGADLDATNINISGLDASNDFSSPDGLWFARPTNASGLVNPILWVQTDDGAYTDVTNCMMLAAMPGTVGDGGTKSITNTGASGTATQSTIMGKAPGASLKRFLVGPKDCEITGVDSTPDGKALFVGIQHPGENGSIAAQTSSWPETQTNAAATARPRSAVVVITRTDGGVVGLS
jgi:uncharacterized protein